MKNPFSLALLTSLVVSFVVCFVFFFFLRADIVDMRSSAEQLLEEQDSFLQRSLDDNLSTMQDTITANIASVMDSVVHIIVTKNIALYFTQSSSPDASSRIDQQMTLGGGSGIAVSKSGFIVTNKHVVQDPNASYTVVTNDGKTYPIERVWFDPNLDIAVVKIQDDTKNPFADAVHIASFSPIDYTIGIGQFVFAVGYTSTQLSPVVTLGIVGVKDKTFTIKQSIYAGLLQTDASMAPGDSGGPLLDIHGRVLAINTAMDSSTQGVNFALPVTQEFIDRTIQSIIDYQKIVRPFVGIVYADISPAFAKELDISRIDHGIYIQDVVPDSPAAKAGLLAGDIVVSIDDMSIDMDRSFLYMLYTYGMYDTIRLHVLRNGDSQFIEVSLGKKT